MAFHVYPDPATAPLTVPGATTAAPVSVAELVGTVNGIDTMFLTVAISAPVLGPAPAALATPSISLSANGATAITITSVNGVDPTPLTAGADVYGTVYDEGNGVYRAEVYKFTSVPIAWAVTLRNNDAGPVQLTWVVADAEAQARQSWVDVPAALDWDDLVGKPLTGQDVPLTAAVGNRGTGPLSLALAPGVVGASDFEVLAVPGPVTAGAAGDLGLVFHAPATPGAVTGVVLDLGANDPQAAAALPAHPTEPQLAATRGQLEVMLLLDGSGSMGYQPDGTPKVSDSDTRWAKMVAAAEQFLTLLGHFGDGQGRFGVNVFPDITDPAFPPTAPSPTAAHLHEPEDITEAAITAAIGDLDVDHIPQPRGGATPIGFGIGFTMGETSGSYGDYLSLPAAKDQNRRVMVLMSDGAQNSGPLPSIYWRADEGNGCPDAGTAAPGRSFADKKVQAITVAYGDPEVTAFEVDHDLLALIACKSGGTALDALADDAGLDLLKSFRDALVNGLALDPTVDPGGILVQGAASVRRTVSVLASDQRVSFVADWVSDRRGRLRIDLLTPGCELISSDGENGAGVSVHQGSRFVIVTVDESFLRNDADPEHPRYGEWTMIVTANLGIEDSERYQYAVLTRSRLRLRLTANSSGYAAGDTVSLVADLRLDGRPVRNAAVTVYHDRPGAAAANWLAAQPVSAGELAAAQQDLADPEATAIGVKAHALHRRGETFSPFTQAATLPMTAEPDGRYTLTVPGNPTPGTYTFRAVATGELDGVPFRREQRLQVRVGVRPDPAFTLVDIGYAVLHDRPAAVVTARPRDRFLNAVLIDPAIDPSIDIQVAGTRPLTGVEGRLDGSYTRTVTLPGQGTPRVSVSVGGLPVVTGRPMPAPAGLHYADRVLEFTAGAQAEPGANQHADPAAVLGDPGTPPRDFLALGAAGQVTVAAGEQHVLARGDDDVNIVVADARALRSYRVQAQRPVTGKWVDLGTSAGTAASFSLGAAGLRSSPAIRVTDTSLRTREPDLSVSHAPGAQIAGVGFRAVGDAPSSCLGLPSWLLKQLCSLWRRTRDDLA